MTWCRVAESSRLQIMLSSGFLRPLVSRDSWLESTSVPVSKPPLPAPSPPKLHREQSFPQGKSSAGGASTPPQNLQESSFHSSTKPPGPHLRLLKGFGNLDLSNGLTRKFRPSVASFAFPLEESGLLGNNE